MGKVFDVIIFFIAIIGLGIIALIKNTIGFGFKMLNDFINWGKCVVEERRT